MQVISVRIAVMIMRFFCLLICVFMMVSTPGHAQQTPVIPNFWDPQERFIKPNVKSLPRLRFLTTTDFPPFSFIDKNKRLTGFHVDLARAICRELEVLPVCQIQAVPFSDLQKELIDGTGDAILAGLNVSKSARADLTFTRPYFRLPARFVAKKDSNFAEPLSKTLSDKIVGVVDGTAHAALAKAQFGDVQLRLFDTQEAALTSLEKGEVSAVFSDGLSLSFWMQSKGADKSCCRFVGGPYLSETYLGNGLTIALRKDNSELEDALNFALRNINDRGTFAELYLRYFPISLY